MTETPLRVALISEHANPLAPPGGVDAGGQNVHVEALATALARRGHDVTVYTRRDGPHLPLEVDAPGGFRVVHVPAGPPERIPRDGLLPYMGAFGQWLAEQWTTGPAPDAVHTHFWMSGVAALEAAKAYRGRPVPLVSTFHALGTVKRRMQGAADTSPADRIVLETMVARSADRVIAQCADEVAELLRMGVRRERIDVVPSGVDTDVFHPAEGGPSTRPDGRPARLLSVGRLVERKGYADIVQTLRTLPDAELLIAGGPAEGDLRSDPEAQRLVRTAAEYGVGDRLRLLGAVDRWRMPALYQAVDVVICAPAYEPFGMTPLEAMACGTPVVAYAVGGLTDSVIHGTTGLLVEPRNVAQLSESIGSLLDDESLRYAYATGGLRRVRGRYPWTRIAEQVEVVYRSVRAPEPAAGLPFRRLAGVR
ncbi:MAG: glycosyltransferase [Hamadaea sp.]|uniref:glycosyltransferase n=1 Tax=Hamadaea sp. TaxID=2024425 RepID=UPI00185DCA9E|nr:glycosyltransferase [Hamadaea sp.]NUR69299.1 glycosyltransferase [Hamadaea sp.]NUT21997.1 glycosyltransferase [Hamadaea sp.]